MTDHSLLNVVFVGHVDHGKSTVIGRLLSDSGALPDGKLEAVKAMCERRGMPFEWAFLMDAFQAERDQGITIDTARIFFATERRRYAIIDAPGHKEFLRNMVTGASEADAAVLIIDAQEGVAEQTRRHALILNLIGVRQVILVVNKMDLVDYSEARFRAIADEAQDRLEALGYDRSRLTAIPVAARIGAGIAARGDTLGWYDGQTLIEALDALDGSVAPVDLPLRLPVQDIYKFDDRRIIAGKIESGRIRTGDELLFTPSGHTAKIASVEGWPESGGDDSEAGMSVGIQLDEDIFVERGEVASHKASPPALTDRFRARLFWLSEQPLAVGRRLQLLVGTASLAVRVVSIDAVLSSEDLSRDEGREEAQRHDVVEATFESVRRIALDPYDASPATGRFVLQDGYRVVAGGAVLADGLVDKRDRNAVKSTNITRVIHSVPTEDRWRANGHKSGVLWLTGLSGSGKSTLAIALEEALFRKGWQAYVLDGDNIRYGLSADLGFAPEDRAENIRRVGEVAALMARSGQIVITAFISPYRSDRDRAREIIPGLFHEVHVDTSLAECERRDPKGLYAKARAGEIRDFTGIDAPYEPPESPELVIATDGRSIDETLREVLRYVERRFAL
jgi:bifunctional enzyme CysN/CysC